MPAILVLMCVDIAVYRLSPDHGRITEEVRLKYSEALKWLGKLTSRLVSLGVAEVDIPPTLNGGVVRYGPERLMTREGLKGLL
jgi:phage gp36-like protein